MELTVTIDEKEISEIAVDTLTKKAIAEINGNLFEESHYNFLRRIYKEDIQKEIRTIVKAHETDIIEKAISEAARIIAKKALPKYIEKEEL